MKYKNVFFDPNNQKVRWTQHTTDDLPVTYDYVGSMTRVEFDVLIEVLWFLFDDSDIPLQEFKKYYKEIREFCDNIKKIT